MTYLLAMLIGIVAGSRTLTAPAAVSWATYAGILPVHDTGLAFLGYWLTPYIFTVLAAAEFVADQLPTTPSRKAPVGFGARIATGALSGAAIGASGGSWLVGLVAGVIGAVIGTLAFYAFRMWLATAIFHRDRPAAVIEDIIAIGAAALIVCAA
jgi:uncharacterized membrane protein